MNNIELEPPKVTVRITGEIIRVATGEIVSTFVSDPQVEQEQKADADEDH